MPELPEMENYRIQLSQHILDLPITGVNVGREKSVNLPAADFARELMGRQVIFIERRGKNLLFHLDNGRRLLLHLMLGGLLYLGSKEDRPERSTQVEITFGEKLVLYFIGLRLGHLHLHSAKEAEELLSHLGPELLDRRMNEERFTALLRKRRGVLRRPLSIRTSLPALATVTRMKLRSQPSCCRWPSCKISAMKIFHDCIKRFGMCLSRQRRLAVIWRCR